MVPFPMLPTDSAAERRLYEGFLEQLGEEYVVYHSVDWVLADRIGGPEQGEADFVIAHPEDGVLVIEAKGGELVYDPSTRRWTQGGRSGRHQLREDPFHQARDEMHSLIRILEAQSGWEEWRPSYGYALALPDGRYDADAHPGAPAAYVIDHDDLERLDARVREIMRSWRRGGRSFGERGMASLETALGFRVAIRTPMKLAFDQDDRRILELTQEQSYVRAFVLHRERAVVTGPPGSGKTVLAIGIAEHLAAEGKRTLLTCFNKRLADHLRVSTEGTPNLHVDHLHGLCAELVREAGLDLPEPAGPDDRDYFEHALPGLLEEAARKLGPRFDAIVVDEAQDFRGWWWPALLSLHRDPDRGTLYLFADDSQNLYGGGDPPVGPDDVLPPLPHNLRNSAAIHSFVSVFFDAAGTVGVAKGPRGRDVEVLDYANDEELFHLLEVVLTNLTEEEELPLDDLVVLTPAGKEKSKVWQRRTFGRFSLSDEPEEGTVLWSTVHAFKGLERSVVVLAELGDRHREDIDRFVRVGGSRARHHLIVLAARPVAVALRRRASVASP